MPSPFPGMDPYIEDYEWPDFHTSLAVVMRNAIAKQLPPELIVDIEVTTITQSVLFTPPKNYRPDLTVYTTGQDYGAELRDDGGVEMVETPPSIELPQSYDQEVKQRTLHIKKAVDGLLVAIVEILSPANKVEPNLSKYRQKRKTFIAEGIHVLELDLLREGTRPFHAADLSACTYCVQLDHAHRQRCLVWLLDLATPLPKIRLPLLPEMKSIIIDLQSCLDQNYADGLYSRKLRYQLPLKPPLRRDVDRVFIETVGLSTGPATK